MSEWQSTAEGNLPFIGQTVLVRYSDGSESMMVWNYDDDDCPASIKFWMPIPPLPPEPEPANDDAFDAWYEERLGCTQFNTPDARALAKLAWDAGMSCGRGQDASATA